MEARQLRTALGHFATGVAIVTASDGSGTPVGMTVSSFNTVSLDPPLVLFSLDRKALSLPAFVAATHLAINVLSEEQDVLSTRFAARGGDKWGQTSWHYGSCGCPLIDGALVQFECKRHRIYDGGDHLVLICRVLTANLRDANDHPLVFWRGAYRTLAQTVA